MGFQHWWLINHVQAKQFKQFLIQGDHLFLDYYFFGAGGCLIRRGLLILTWHYPSHLRQIHVFLIWLSFEAESGHARTLDFHLSAWARAYFTATFQY